ncbi:hypothetical protein ACTMSW_24915 [Micromonospora sp. BQ11]|uniref:hypothetical protein n=1 Tax=Micromonospora sp. BQ11 TaxID=3452212 RepID=UPI003F8C3156
MVKLRQSPSIRAVRGLDRRRASRVSRRHRSSARYRGAELPLTTVRRNLQRLRADIEVFVNAAGTETTPSRRAALVEVHHQLRLLGQRVNAALGAPSVEGEKPQQT